MTIQYALMLGAGVLVVLSGKPAQAQSLVGASSEALTKTQELLRSPEQRADFIKSDAAAKEADDRLNAIPGLSAEDRRRAYDISAQMMATLVNQTGGDVPKQKAMLDQASRDPQSFFNNLPADQRKQIEDLAAGAGAHAEPAAN